MLKEWIERDAKPCYCKLISEIYQEGLVQERNFEKDWYTYGSY